MNKVIVTLLVFLSTIPCVLAVNTITSMDISPMVCTSGVRSGGECIDLHECASYYDGCNDCMITADGEIGGCTKKACTQQSIPRCTKFVMPTNLTLTQTHMAHYNATWKKVELAMSVHSKVVQEKIYANLVMVLSAKVQDMLYTQRVGNFGEADARKFALKLDSYRYFLYKARTTISVMYKY